MRPWSLWSPAAPFLASRGVVEAKTEIEEFGMQRVKEALREIQWRRREKICVSVLDRMRLFMGNSRTHNDVTALALARNP